MDISATESDFAGWIAEALRARLVQQEHEYTFSITSASGELTVPLPKARLSECIDHLRALNATAETALANSRSFEVLLREESPIPRMRMRMRDEPLSIADPDNAIRYTISGPSNEYLLYLLLRAASIASARLLSPPISPRMIERGEPGELVDAFDLLRRYLGRFITLRVDSEKERSAAEFDRFANSMLFQLCFNLDAALVRQLHLDEILRTSRLSRVRRLGLTEFDPPRRHYIADLVYHYQLGVAVDNPFLEYLSYYHVAEHFFEDVFSRELVDRIRDRLTRPDFSYKRQKDVANLIKEISKSLQIRNERITFSESEALRLTLAKHVDLDALRDSLNSYDTTLVDYYRTSPVDFAGAESVDLADTDASSVHKKLAGRIYKTRNAIVHSKESDRARYTPFKDDRVLLREVPLLRFVAEQIIVQTSTTIS